MDSYKYETVLKIRAELGPDDNSHTDYQIASAYSEYCEEFHAASWTDTNIAEFVKWATTTPFARYPLVEEKESEVDVLKRRVGSLECEIAKLKQEAIDLANMGITVQNG